MSGWLCGIEDMYEMAGDDWVDLRCMVVAKEFKNVGDDLLLGFCVPKFDFGIEFCVDIRRWSWHLFLVIIMEGFSFMMRRVYKGILYPEQF